ncbi:MAG: hypothetical protein O6768_09465 [Planctomycetota bacterium]|nr:hypothetical protein [Planctomycetota bacterium]
MHDLVGERFGVALARFLVCLVSLVWLSAIGQAAPAPIAETATESSPRVASEEAQWVVVKTQPGRGEQCLVCGLPIRDANAVFVRYKGRLFAVTEKLMDDFAGDPDRYFSQLQVLGALFDERAPAATPPHQFWLFLGLYVLAGLVAGGACGYLAVCKGLPPVRWFFGGLVVNVAAIAALLCMHKSRDFAAPAGIPAGLCKVPTTYAPVYCPHCGAENHPATGACSDCGAAMQPSVTAETDRI